MARRAGFPARVIPMAVSVALAESGGMVHARCYNTGHGCSSHPFRGQRSVDQCLWQINDHAHPWSTHMNIDDPVTCARAALRVSHGGRDWRPWSTVLSGANRRWLSVARRAAGL